MSIIWIIISEETLRLNDGIIVSVFLIVSALATVLIVYYFASKPKEQEEIEEIKEQKPKNKIHNKIAFITRRITLIIYLVISFITMAWHITWLIWIIYTLIIEIIKLVFMLRGNDYEE